ncbi:DUF1631 domain-containing protein [Thiohalobacter sp.]|uniref:DUF1631 domain-containing protein n=1 Tax=Thiohalobacter sp. TaxID=2025948 RepID=UPI00262AF378|nr:DUF1631 domain-containing protein [Thiohalobacter sp.]
MTASQENRSPAVAPRFRSLMEACRKMTPSHLGPLFARLLENIEVGMLEAADRAENNELQAEYFAVMNTIKRDRQQILQRFLKEVDEGFRQFLEGELEPIGNVDLEHVSADKLSLVDKADMDWALPIQNIVGRASTTYIEELYGLNQRLAIVNGGVKLPPEQWPGGPYRLAEAFARSLGDLRVQKPVRLMLFVSFDRHVMRELKPYLDEYNRRMINAGILPNLSYEVRKNPSRARPAAGGGAEAAEPAPGTEGGTSPDGGTRATAAASSVEGIPGADGTEVARFQRLRGLLAGRRGGGGEGQFRNEPSAQVAGLARERLVGALSTVQGQAGAHPATEAYFEELTVDEQLLARLQEMLDEERERIYEHVDRKRMASEDLDVIDLVGMLFEFMLRDANLPDVAKALLSRLHTPYLKVALLDKAFFVQKRHPARRLLDTMVTAGERWIVADDLKRGVFPCMREIVERVIDEFDDDLALFDELLAAFQSRVREIEQKANKVEQRAVEAAAGQEKLKAARRRAHASMARLLEERRITDEMFHFFSHVWAEKLMFILLREPEGEESPAWKLALRVAADIVETVEPESDPQRQAERRERLPELRLAIAQALDDLSAYGRRDNARMLAQIEAWQEAALAEPETVAESVAEARHGPDPEAAPEPEPQERKAAVAPEVAAQMDRLCELEFGTWFEFSDPASHLVRRLRLAWYSKVSGRFMFVDAIGTKADEWVCDELAAELVAGRARIVEPEKRPFLERALDAVMSFLGRGLDDD